MTSREKPRWAIAPIGVAAASFALLAAQSARAQTGCDPQWLSGEPGFDSGVYALVADGPTLYAAGSFLSTPSGPATRAASWDGATWSPMGDNLDSSVYAMTRWDQNIVAVGDMWRNDPLAGAALWDGTAWTPIGTSVFGSTTPLCVGVYNGSIAVGTFGYFSTAFLYWRAASGQWGQLGKFTTSGFQYPLPLWAVREFKGDLIVGGAFDVSYVGTARFDGSAWFSMQSTSITFALTELDGTLYRGSAGVWRWTGSDWIPLGPPTIGGSVYTLGTYRGELIAAGRFTSIGGVSASKIARWNGTEWLPLGLGLNGDVRSLAEFNGELIVAGEFMAAGSEPSPFLARWTDRPVPWFAKHPQDSGTIEPGGEAEFHITPASGYDVTHQWQFESASGGWCDLADGVGSLCLAGSQTLVSGAKTPSLALSSVDLAAAGRYRCVMSNECEDVASAPAALSVACAADCERDDDLDIFDVLCFQQEFFNQTSYADCEQDGDWDVFDFLCFQQLYFQGCG